MMLRALKLLTTCALIAGPMSAYAQATADEEAGVNATPPAAPPMINVINPSRTLIDAQGHLAHIFPAYSPAMAEPLDTGPLLYHAGGPVMTQLNIYTIYWAPSTLQDGSATSLGVGYTTVLSQLAQDYTAHTIDSNNTQYYQTINGVTTYISGQNNSAGASSLGGTYTDTTGYPSGGCTLPTGYIPNPTNCVTDTALRSEITKVMGIMGWTGGLNKIFVIFTSANEGSFFSATGYSYANYCAYHSYIAGATPIVYANMPYGSPVYCYGSGANLHTSNPATDPATTAMSHEVSEAVTDPELDAWFTAAGSEIGDLCAYNYGTNGYDASLANQHWNGHFYELQMEWDNHKNGCQQVGP